MTGDDAIVIALVIEEDTDDTTPDTQPDRIPLDALTSNALDALYDERDALRAELARCYQQDDDAPAPTDETLIRYPSSPTIARGELVRLQTLARRYRAERDQLADTSDQDALHQAIYDVLNIDGAFAGCPSAAAHRVTQDVLTAVRAAAPTDTTPET